MYMVLIDLCAPVYIDKLILDYKVLDFNAHQGLQCFATSFTSMVSHIENKIDHGAFRTAYKVIRIATPQDTAWERVLNTSTSVYMTKSGEILSNQ